MTRCPLKALVPCAYFDSVLVPCALALGHAGPCDAGSEDGSGVGSKDRTRVQGHADSSIQGRNRAEIGSSCSRTGPIDPHVEPTAQAGIKPGLPSSEPTSAEES